MEHYIYIHRRATDNTVFYVGKGVKQRAYRLTGRNEYWSRTHERHGINIEILKYFESKKEAFAYEKELITQFIKEGAILCNLAPGGEGGSNPEQLKKLHESNVGSKRTEESKLKLKTALKGLIKKSGKESKCCKFKTIATNLATGIEIVMFGTKEITAAGFKQGSVAGCLSGRRSKHKNHTFKKEPII